MKLLLVLISATLAGCATVQGFAERHPVAVSASVIVLAGSIKAMQDSRSINDHRAIPSSPCVTPEACR